MASLKLLFLNCLDFNLDIYLTKNQTRSVVCSENINMFFNILKKSCFQKLSKLKNFRLFQKCSKQCLVPIILKTLFETFYPFKYRFLLTCNTKLQLLTATSNSIIVEFMRQLWFVFLITAAIIISSILSFFPPSLEPTTSKLHNFLKLDRRIVDKSIYKSTCFGRYFCAIFVFIFLQWVLYYFGIIHLKEIIKGINSLIMTNKYLSRIEG
jgi:hypothetical protein